MYILKEVTYNIRINVLAPKATVHLHELILHLLLNVHSAVYFW